MGKSQREYFLRQQLKAIQRELGEEDPDQAELAELRRRTADARRALDLPADTGPTLRRRVAAIAETWAGA